MTNIECSTCKYSAVKKYEKTFIGYCKLNLEQQYVKNWYTKCEFYVRKEKNKQNL